MRFGGDEVVGAQIIRDAAADGVSLEMDAHATIISTTNNRAKRDRWHPIIKAHERDIRAALLIDRIKHCRVIEPKRPPGEALH